jgi:KTSC domain-containing protein
MPRVDSSMIRRIEYEEPTRELDITFTSGKTYTYSNVPKSVYERFLRAPSKGQFFNDYIKDQYSFA